MGRLKFALCILFGFSGVQILVRLRTVSSSTSSSSSSSIDESKGIFTPHVDFLIKQHRGHDDGGAAASANQYHQRHRHRRKDNTGRTGVASRPKHKENTKRARSEGARFGNQKFYTRPKHALTGGELPMNREYTDPSTWTAIDNETCLYDINDNKSRSEPLYEWQRRAPYAMVLGTMKGGTQALVQYLYQHPMIVPRDKRLEEHFFNSDDFERNESGIPVRSNQQEYAWRFQESYTRFFVRDNDDDDDDEELASLVAKPNKYTIDNTPYYLFGSEQIPSAVLCVAPWVKLLAILRNPVDRADSQYRYLNQNRQLYYGEDMVDWEVWVNHDIELLTTAGVLQDWNVVDFDTFAGSEAEMIAWKRYVRSPNSMYLVGRGLYAIQLQHWYQAMQRAGKPASDLMVIHAEEMRNATQTVYNEIIDFLELPPFVLADASAKHETLIESLPMPESVRKRLEELYDPYNQRLYKMLGWDTVWDPPRQ